MNEDIGKSFQQVDPIDNDDANSITNNHNHNSPNNDDSDPKDNNKSCFLRVRNRIDDFCLVAFPVAFVAFNVVYWSVCLSHAPRYQIYDPGRLFRAEGRG